MGLGLCRFTNAAGGTVDWTYPGPTIDMQSPASAGAVNGTVYEYYAQSLDMSQWEIGTGAYNSGTGVFVRTTVLANSLGTTAKVSFLNPPQIVVFDNRTSTLGAVRIQKFTASGTYTPDPHLVYAVVECVGGGGAGGSVEAAAVGFFEAAGGGGGGGYSRLTVPAATLGASKAVTIGAGGVLGSAGNFQGGGGGDTSLGTLCIAKGGTGGSGNFGGQGGVGGVAGTGDLSVPGQPGQTGLLASWDTSTNFASSNGGASGLGFGPGGQGRSMINGGGTTGTAGSLYGGGGSSGCSANTTGAVQGTLGAAGLVMITEYCSQ